VIPFSISHFPFSGKNKDVSEINGKACGYISGPPFPQALEKKGPPTSFLAGGPKMVLSGDG